MVLDTFKMGINAVLHPDTGTKTNMDVWNTVKMYYGFSVIPVIVYAVLAAILVLGLGSLTGGLGGYVGLGLVAIIAYIVLIFWIYIPFFGLFAGAGALHVFGNILGVYKQSFDNTFAAVVYPTFFEMTVGIVFLIVGFVIGGLVGSLGVIVIFLFFVIFIAWAIYILTVALANQHKISRFDAFKPILVLIVIGVVLAVLVYLGANLLAPPSSLGAGAV